MSSGTLFADTEAPGIDFPDLPADRFNGAWRAAAQLRPVNPGRVAWMIEGRHYLRCWPAVQTCLLGLFIQRQAVGVIVYAMPPREMFQRFGGEVWELARLWIDDAIPRNAETWMIGASVRFIKRYHPKVKALVSYADPSAGHSGTIYRAANWTYDGMTDAERKSPRFDYTCGGKKFSRAAHVPAGAEVLRVPRVSKHRFVYPLDGG